MACVYRGQCEKSRLEYKLQFRFWLSMAKDRAKSFNKIGFSYTDKEGDTYCVFYNGGHISMGQNLWLSRKNI